MPIRPFLSGQAFEPEAIRNMALALEGVCGALGLRMTRSLNWHSAAFVTWIASGR